MEVSRNGSQEGLTQKHGGIAGEFPRATEILSSEPVAVLPGPQGNDLIRSISAITGLGEESVKSEVAEMLTLSGQQSQTDDLSRLSLEELRAAMLVYLETINADMTAGEDSSSSPMSVS